MVDAASQNVISEHNVPVFASQELKVMQLEVGPYESPVVMVISIHGSLVSYGMQVAIDDIEIIEGMCASIGMFTYRFYHNIISFQ